MAIQAPPSSPLASTSRAEGTALHASSALRPGVMARLHALFPTHSPDVHQGETARRRTRPPAKFLKVRIMTWNMHDSLPKGELEDLLGAVHDDQDIQTPVPGGIPDLPLDPEHPYHLLVVAGQECPSISGLPMALGAGFKLNGKDKERDKSKEKDDEKDKKKKEKDKDREKDRDSQSDEPRTGRPHESEKVKDEDDRRRSRHISLLRHSHQRSEEDDFMANASASAHDLLASLHHPYGWTSMLEDWFCNGDHADTPMLPSAQDETQSNPGSVPLSPKSRSTGDLNSRIQPVSEGPYELLAKERMMGLYLAIFIRRDCRQLVRGTSKSSVTAGLIGGRVGNKGGVGISLNMNGTTFLFLNAHLAAHEGKMQHRLNNLAKIKAELAVDTFLPSDDPRMMAEDLTDRFDFTFIFGDLNFRLDITRLHADWLISRREYRQALAFDQLRKVMQNEEAFIGFNEAPIDFPPTFKYDVLRSKRSRHRSSKRMSRNPVAEAIQLEKHEKQLTEIEERHAEIENDVAKSDDEIEIEVDNEALSVASTSYSRYTDTEDPEKEKYDYFLPPPSPHANGSSSNIVNKVLYSAAAHKAKAKWISLISSPHTPMHKWKKTNRHSDSKSMASSNYEPPSSPLLPEPPTPEFRASMFPPTPDPSDANKDLDGQRLTPARSIGSSENGRLSVPNALGGRANSTRSTSKSDDKDEDDTTKFNYDSSHKQRVPSWCDRILWKSTIVPTDDIIEEVFEPPPPPRTRMGSLLFALRPNSSRARKDSITSVELTPTSPHTPDNLGFPRSPAPEQLDTPPPIAAARPSFPHSHSSDALPLRAKPQHLLLRDEARARKPSLPSLLSRTPPVPATAIPSSSRQRFPRSDTPAAMSPLPSSGRELLPPPVPVTSLWRTFSFLPFLSRDGVPPSERIPDSADPNTPPTPDPESPLPTPRRRGDVVCLAYDTLDDAAMLRLQAKSDHRPVIGSYAVFV